MFDIAAVKKRSCELLACLARRPGAHRNVARTDFATAVARLPEPARSVYRLSARDSLSDEAIAARLGLTVAQVQRDLACALAMLDRGATAASDTAAVASRRGRG